MSKWLVAGLLLVCLIAHAEAGDAPSGPQQSPAAVLAGAARDAAGGNAAAAIAALQSLEADGIPPALRQQVDLLLGMLLVRQGMRAEAIPRLERAAATYPLLADYALWYLAEARRGSTRLRPQRFGALSTSTRRASFSNGRAGTFPGFGWRRAICRWRRRRPGTT
jgi:hypothetical protein